MAAAVSEVRVEDGFVKVSLAGLELYIKEQIGFINATQLCNFKGKKLNRYNEAQQRKNLKIVLTSYYGDLTNPVNSNVQCLAGTYFHPALLLDLANWLSPETYVGAATIIDVFFNKTKQRRWQLSVLFACEEIATYENEPPNCWIRFKGLDLTVNERGWFKTAEFCRANGKKVKDFETRKDSVALLQYFRTKGQFRGAHYHPLLFLRLAAWVDTNFYVKSARVIFCCVETRLKSLFRREIAAFNVESAATSNGSTNGVLIEATPSTSTGQATSRPTFTNVDSSICKISVVAPARLMQNGGQPVDVPSTSAQTVPPAPSGIIWNLDDDSDDSNMTLDLNEADSTLTRKEHEVELARVRRELQLVVERERREKEAALAREREKEAALARVQEENRAAVERERLKDDQLEQLRRQLEDLEINDSRMTLRKRSYAESRANAAATIVNDVGVAGLECLVLFVSTENAVYGYRRQFQNIVPAIHKQLHKVAKFVGWFVTNNAVLDYNRCKTLVSEKAKECGRVLRLTQNQMELDDDEGAKFDLPDAIRTTLRIDLEVIEADVKILGRLFHKPTYHDDNPAAEPQRASSTFLDRVHRWIEDEHASFMSVLERRQQRRNQRNQSARR